MTAVWIIIALIYFFMSILSFLLASKSRKRQVLEEIHLAQLPPEPYEPKGNVGFSVTATITNEGVKSESRAQVFVDIVRHFNKQIGAFQDYINKATLPKLQEYIDSTSKVNTTGFVIAGIVSLIGTITAVLSLFLVD